MAQESVAEKRTRFFNLFSRNIGTYFPGYVDLFVCPLCTTAFGRDALDKSGILTLEHCISGKLGGSIETLTCGNCNNSHGSEFDSQLVNKHRSEDSMLGLSGQSLKGSVNIAGVEVQARITMKPAYEGIIIKFVHKASHPDSVKAAINEIEEKGQIPGDLKLSVTWSMDYNKSRYQVGLLRSAYLTLFSCFGYRYMAMDYSGQIIRQIKNPYDDVLPVADLLMPLPDDFPISNCVAVVRTPSELRGFLVPIKSVSDHRTTITGVLLPGLGSGAIGFQERVGLIKSQNQRVTVTCDAVPFSDRFITSTPSEYSDEAIWFEFMSGIG